MRNETNNAKGTNMSTKHNLPWRAVKVYDDGDPNPTWMIETPGGADADVICCLRDIYQTGEVEDRAAIAKAGVKA
jgi:hypothetical protein